MLLRPKPRSKEYYNDIAWFVLSPFSFLLTDTCYGSPYLDAVMKYLTKDGFVLPHSSKRYSA